MTNSLLLVNPPIYDFAAHDFFIKPLGLLYLSAILRRAGLEPYLIDALDRNHPAMLADYPRGKSQPDGTGKYFRQPIPRPACLAKIKRRYCCYGMPLELIERLIRDYTAHQRPAAVLVTSMMTYWYPAVADTIAMIRRTLPGVPIALGGVYAGLMPDHARRVCQPDRVFPGAAVTDLLNWLATLPGVKLTDTHAATDNFLDWPAPDYSHYPTLDYLTVTTSVGCLYHCRYCAGPVLQPRLRQLAPDTFVDHLLSLLPRLGQNRPRLNIAFNDDALLADANHHFIPAMHHLASLNLPLRFQTPNGLHARFITKEVAQLMFDNHFEMIRISYESAGRQTAQLASDDKVSDSHFKQAVENLTAAGFPAKQLNTYLMTHLPGQSLNEIEFAAQVVHNMGLKIRLCQYSPIPNTPLFEPACQRFKLDPDEPLLHNNSVAPSLNPDIPAHTFQQFKTHIDQLNDSLA